MIISERIESRKHPIIEKILSISQNPTSKGFIVEGINFIKDLPAEQVELIVCSENINNDLLAPFEKSEIYHATNSVMKKISDTVSAQNIIALVTAANIDLPNNIIITDKVQDPGNIGTIIRSAAAFDFGVITGNESASPFRQKATRSSAGTVTKIYIEEAENLLNRISTLKNLGYTIYSSELNESALPVEKIRRDKKIAIIIGNESKGVSAEISDTANAKVYIPINRTAAESLNAGIAASIFMFEISK